MSNKDRLLISEKFYAWQGENFYTGVPSLWSRFYKCQLECRGFSQPNPADPTTYLPVGNDMDLSKIKMVEELPVFSVGCDSAYSVSLKFEHLIPEYTIEQYVDELTALLPTGKFQHARSNQWVHKVFTGGEPLLQVAQRNIIQILNEFKSRDNLPKNVTIETNGGRKLLPELEEYIKQYVADGNEWFWSISPKLLNTSGEQAKKAIKPEVIKSYQDVTSVGSLKFVVNGSKASWDELEYTIDLLRSHGINFPVWVMGVGGTIEGLKITEAMIADEAIQRGYNYSSRVHVHVYGNALGK